MLKNSRSALPNPLPSTMTVMGIRHPGGPEVLVPEKRPMPAPSEHEVLIRVAAAGVNRPDVAQRKGLYPPPKGASDIPGLEVAGEVVALGSGVRRWKIGDLVVALIAGGGYAEFCTVNESNALLKPSSLSMIEAAAVPETYFTVWHNVFERGALKKEEVLLVHGGSSGIGTTAIQLAKAFGAKVIVTVGSKEKSEACLALGANLAIDYKREDFVQATLTATGGRGADLILDMIGGSYVERNYKAAAIEGRIVQIAFQEASQVNLNLVLLLTKRLTHTGSTLRARSVLDKAAIARALEEKVWPLLEKGQIKPVIYKTFPLAEAAQAHTLMETSSHIGKIVLTLS